MEELNAKILQNHAYNSNFIHRWHKLCSDGTTITNEDDAFDAKIEQCDVNHQYEILKIQIKKTNQVFSRRKYAAEK